MKTIDLLLVINPIKLNIETMYIIGAVITVFILAYLIYSLIKPEKF